MDGWTIVRVPDPGFELVLPQDAATQATLQADLAARIPA